MTFATSHSEPPTVLKAISLWQPWASLVANGHKMIETRSWSTTYRGTLLIHAAKHWSAEIDEMCYQEPFARLLKGRQHRLPLGAVVAVARLATVVPVEFVFDKISPQERALGDYNPSRFAWIVSNVRPLPQPFPLKARQRLFNAVVPPEALP